MMDIVTTKRRPPEKGGSRKGIPNKVTKELKDMILTALDGAGGVQYLTERARDPRTASAFLTLVGKTLPLTVKGPGAGGSHIFQKIIVEVIDVRQKP
jgi:hypothetical protein